MFDWFFNWCDKYIKVKVETVLPKEEESPVVEDVLEPTIYSLLLAAIKEEVVSSEEMDEFIKTLDEGYTDYLLAYKKVGYGRILSIQSSSEDDGEVYRKYYTVVDNCSGISFKTSHISFMEVRGYSGEGFPCDVLCESDLCLLFETVSSLNTQMTTFRFKLKEHKQKFKDAENLQKLKDCQCKAH